MIEAVCRDCLAELERASARCPHCSSPRLVKHHALDSLHLAHVDCDAFFATVEKRDNPTLLDKPVIVGGGKRGVVAAACYIARTYGVRSAMPMFEARQRCPEAVVIRPNIAKYREAGRAVRQAMLTLTPLVEPLSIDEAFLDLSGTQVVHGASPAATLARFARDIERDLGITVSVGLSCNKVLAKIASDLDKPRGFAVLTQTEGVALMKDKPVSFIYGVGPATAKRLAMRGFRLIGDLQRADELDLMREFGNDGRRLSRLARGIDPRKVSPVRETKSVSSETTLDQDTGDAQKLARLLWQLSEKVSARLKSADFAGTTVTLKLKTRDFRTRTRARALAAPTQLAHQIYEAAHDLLMHETDGTLFRLIGVGISHLVNGRMAEDGDLIDKRAAHAERAMDQLKKKFGNDSIVRGLSFAPRGKGEAPVIQPDDSDDDFET